MSLDLSSNRASTFVDSSGVNHIVWVEDQFIWHATYDSNSGTWQNADTIAFIGNEKVKNLSIVGGEDLITTTSGANTLPGLAVVWQQGEGNNTELFYTAGRFDRTQNLQWFANAQQITQDEVEDSDPSVFLQDNELIIVSSKVNLDNANNFAVKEDKDLYYQRFTITEDLFPSSTPEVVINAPYIPDTENNTGAFIIDDGQTENNTLQSRISTENQELLVTNSFLSDEQQNNFVDGLIGATSIGAQIKFSANLLELFPITNVLKSAKVPKALLDIIFGIFKVDGSLSASLYPETFTEQGGIFTGDGGSVLLKTSAKLGLGGEKKVGTAGGFEDVVVNLLKEASKVKVGFSAALENKSTYITNNEFPLENLKDKASITFSLGYNFGYPPVNLTLTGGVGANLIIKAVPVEGEEAKGILGLTLVDSVGVPLISVGVPILLTGGEAELNAIVLQAIISSIAGTILNGIFGPVVLNEEQNLEALEISIGLPQLSLSLDAQLGTKRFYVSAGASIIAGLDISREELFANIAFDVNAGINLGPITFGVDFYPSWDIPLVEFDSNSDQAKLATTNNLPLAQLTSENPAQVFGSLLFLDLGTELVNLPSSEDFTVNVTNPDGTISQNTVFEVLQGITDTSVILRLQNVVPPSPQLASDNEPNSDTERVLTISFNNSSNLLDAQGNVISNIDDLAVVNNTPITASAVYNPTTGSSEDYTSSNNELFLNFGFALDSNITPDVSRFTVTDNATGNAVPVNAVEVLGSRVSLVLASGVSSANITYNASENIQGQSLIKADSTPLSDFEITTGIEIQELQEVIAVNFPANVNFPTDEPTPQEFTVTVFNTQGETVGTVPVTSINSVNTNGVKAINLYLLGQIGAGQTYTVTYTPRTDDTGLDSFTVDSATNTSTGVTGLTVGEFTAIPIEPKQGVSLNLNPSSYRVNLIDDTGNKTEEDVPIIIQSVVTSPSNPNLVEVLVAKDLGEDQEEDLGANQNVEVIFNDDIVANSLGNAIAPPTISTGAALSNIKARLSNDVFASLTRTKTGQILATWITDVPPIEPIAGFVNGNVVTLNFIDVLGNSTTNEPTPNQFAVTDSDGNDFTVTNVSTSGNSLRLTLDSQVTSNQDLTISYEILPTASNRESLYLNNANTGTKLWIDSFEDFSITNITGNTQAPLLLGVGAILESAEINRVTLVFDRTLQGNPLNSQFTLFANGVEYIIEDTVTVNDNTVILSVKPPEGFNLIGIGDLATISYNGNSLSSSTGNVASFNSQPIITSPSSPTTVLKYGFGPSGDNLLSSATSIPGSSGLNLYPTATIDQRENNVLVWTNYDSSDITTDLIPGEYYDSSQLELIKQRLSEADLFYSIYDANTAQWSIAQPLAQLTGVDRNVVLGEGPNGNLMAAWINVDDNGTPRIYWSSLSYDVNNNGIWSNPQILSSEAQPSLLTELAITSLDGNPTVMWTKERSPSYEELTLSQNPLLYLRLGETEGTTLENSGTWGAGGNGIYENSITLNQSGALQNLNQGIIGDTDSAVLFNGSGTAQSNAVTFSGDSFSVDFWFNPSNDANLVDSLANGSADIEYSSLPSNQTSNTSLSFINNNNSLYLAHKGQTNNNLYISVSDDSGQTWTSIQLPSSMQTLNPPAIALYEDTLYLAYQDAGSNQLKITYSNDNGRTWSNPYQIPGQTTSQSPTLVVYQGQLMTLFVAQGNDRRLIYTYSDDPQSSTSWSVNNNILNQAGTANQTTSSAMAATVLDDNLYIAYRGGNSTFTGNYFLTSTNGTNLNDLSWDVHEEVSILGTGTVGLTNDGEQLYLTYRNSNDDIYLGTSTNLNDWSDFEQIPNQKAKDTPNPTIFNGELLIASPDENNLIDITSVSSSYDPSLVSLSGILGIGIEGENIVIDGINFSLSTNDSNLIKNNDWNYLALTYDASFEQLNLYVNGELVNLFAEDGTPLNQLNISLPSATNLILGSESNNNSFILDEVAFYNDVLGYSDVTSTDVVNDFDNLTGEQLLEVLFQTNDIGEKYQARFGNPNSTDIQGNYVSFDDNSQQWRSPRLIRPNYDPIPTQLSNANRAEWDIVSATSANEKGQINPNGNPDIYLPISLNNQQTGETITSIVVTAQDSNGNTLTWSIGTGEGNQLGVVQGEKLLNPLNPNDNFAYKILSPNLDFDLFVDAGNNNPDSLSNFRYSINGGTFQNVTPASITSEPTTIDFNQVLGIATVTEANDSSLTLIDSGFILNTDNPSIGYVVASGNLNGDLNEDGLDVIDVIIGNRGSTNSEGDRTDNGTVHILFGGGSALTNQETQPLNTNDLTGNTGGVLIKGIDDGGDANGDYPMSLATGDVNGDGIEDLIIGAPNVNNTRGAVYVIYGGNLEGQIIDVTNLGNKGYVINPNNNIEGALGFGFSVAIGDFNDNGTDDIVIGAPGAKTSQGGTGEVYIASDGNTNYSTLYSSPNANEFAGYAVKVSRHTTSSATTITHNTHDDIIIGAPGYVANINNTWDGLDQLPPSANDANFYPSSSPANVGAVYVYKGNETGNFNSNPDLIFLGPDVASSTNGTAQNIFAGTALETVDLDGDGTQDLAISAPGASDNNGDIYVLKGKDYKNNSPQVFNLANVSNLNIVGGIEFSQTGEVISAIGDVNGDHYQDFLITAPQAANGTGQGYVLFGPLNLEQIGTTFDLNLTSNDNKTTFLLNGNLPNQLAGRAGGAIGDINGDKVDDLMITAPNVNQLYNVFGHSWLADNGSIKLANISSDNGFVIDGNLPNNQSLSGNGKDVEILGDINGDGFADILSGGSGDGAILVFGGSTKDILDSATGSQDLIITVDDNAIAQIVKLGDYNGDGLKDFGVLADNGDFYLVLGNSNLASLGNLTLTNPDKTNFISMGAMGDYNGDGYDDFAGEKDGQLKLFLGNGEGSITDNPIQTSLQDFTIGALGDFDGDGYQDLGLGFPLSNASIGNNNNNKRPENRGPLAETNGQFRIYQGNQNAGLDATVVINPFQAELVTILNDNLWATYGYTPNNDELSPTLPTQNQQIDRSPSLVVYNNYLYMVRKDYTNNYLWMSRTKDGFTWEPEISLGSSIQTFKNTSMTVLNDTLYLAYMDTSGRVKVASFVEANNIVELEVDSILQASTDTSKVGPAIVAYEDKLYVFFVGTQGNNSIKYVVSDDGENWSEVRFIEIADERRASDSRISATVWGISLFISFLTSEKQDPNEKNGLSIYQTSDFTIWDTKFMPSSFQSTEGPAILSIDYKTTTSTIYSFYEEARDGEKTNDLRYGTSSVGTVDWTFVDEITNETIDDAPYATFFNQGIFVAYAGKENDSINITGSQPFYEANEAQQLGSQLESIGDFNGDGIEDFAVLAEGYYTGIGGRRSFVFVNNRGAVLVYYGDTDGVSSSSVPDVVLGYPNIDDIDSNLNNIYQMSEIKAIGDINGDGFDDLAVASPNTSLEGVEQTADGVVTVVFGGSNWGTEFSADNPFDLQSLSNNQSDTEDNSNDLGFTIEGLPSSQAGISLGGGEDVNGDGFSDFVIGAPGNDDNLSFVLFGSDFTNKITQTGSIGDDIMVGVPTGESFVAGQGQDIIYTEGGTDVVYAGPDDDFVTVNDTYFRRLDGGTGTDILKFTGYNGQDWDLTKFAQRLDSWEILVTEDYGANTLTLNSVTVNQLSENNTVTVVMDEDDTLNLSSDFVEDGFVNQFGQQFARYSSNNSAATVLVNQIFVPLTYTLLIDDEVGLKIVKSSGETIWDLTERTNNDVSGAVQGLMQTDDNFVLYAQEQSLDKTGIDDSLWDTETANDGVGDLGLRLFVDGRLGVLNQNGGAARYLNDKPDPEYVPNPDDEGVFTQIREGEEIVAGKPLTVTSNNIINLIEVNFDAPNTNTPELITTTIENVASAVFASEVNSENTSQGILNQMLNSEADGEDIDTRLFVSNPTANEADGAVEFTIERTGDLNKYVQTHYISTDGRAKAGSDYNPVLGRVIFAPGETSKTVSVPLPLDEVYTGTREFGLLVTLEKESDTPFTDEFQVRVGSTTGQIRNWTHKALNLDNSLMGSLDFRVLPDENGLAEVKIYFQGNREFDRYNLFNREINEYESFSFDHQDNLGAVRLFDENGDNTPDGVTLHLEDGGKYDLSGIKNGMIQKQGFFADGETQETILDTAIYRFRSLDISGGYLYVGEEERQSILTNYRNSFIEEGLAFYVSDTPEDGLTTFNRFRNTNQIGGYLYAGEEESQSIRNNYPNFVDEGIAFYAYPQGAEMANSITRFQKINSLGSYFYTASLETQTVISNYGDTFNFEGVAFEALLT